VHSVREEKGEEKGEKIGSRKKGAYPNGTKLSVGISRSMAYESANSQETVEPGH
jgi:hypothetical protein